MRSDGQLNEKQKKQRMLLIKDFLTEFFFVFYFNIAFRGIHYTCSR